MKSASGLLITLGFVLSLAACQQAKPDKPLHPLQEAYRLMDEGDNAKAVILLEEAVAEDPVNQEAKLLLASAYAGQAGVDVYVLHKAFEDVLFKKSLSQRFWSKDEGSGLEVPETGKYDDTEKRELNQLGKMVKNLDFVLGDLHRAVIVLNRFPAIKQENWPLLDRALTVLETMKVQKDVALYRAFLTTVYLKAFLSVEVMGDLSLGTKKWACRVNMDEFRDKMIWTLKRLEIMAGDLAIAFPNKAITLADLHATVSGALAGLEELQESAKLAAVEGPGNAEMLVRKYLGCDQTQ